MSVAGDAEARALVAATWGGAAVDALARYAAERRPTGFSVGRVDERCFWLRAFSASMPPMMSTIVFEAAGAGGAWHEVRGVDAWQRVLLSLNLDVGDARGESAALAAFDQLAGGHVLRTEAYAKALTAPRTREQARWVQPPTPAGPDAIRVFEPPHREGRALVFLANLVQDASLATQGPAVVRVTLDVETGAVSLTRLCAGRAEGWAHPMVGRALVDASGAARTAPLVVRP